MFACLFVCLNVHLQEFTYTMCLQSLQRSEVTSPFELVLQTFVSLPMGVMVGVLYPFSLPLTSLPPLLKSPTNFPHHSCLVLSLCLELTLTQYLSPHPTFVVMSCYMLNPKDQEVETTNNREYAALVIRGSVTSIIIITFSSTHFPANFIILLSFTAE